MDLRFEGIGHYLCCKILILSGVSVGVLVLCKSLTTGRFLCTVTLSLCYLHSTHIAAFVTTMIACDSNPPLVPEK